MADKPLMPIATAVWLIDNTSLTFDQIAEFCALHPLQVKGIADGDVGGGVRGIDPITTNQLTRDEIEKGESDDSHKLKLSQPKTLVAERTRKGPRYTPISKRQNRPDAIAWLVKNHPELTDAQISKLLGTTKTTIQSIRDRSHWNSANLEPRDPVGLGLCSQMDLDAAVRKASDRKAKQMAKDPSPEGPALKPITDPVADSSQPLEPTAPLAADAEDTGQEKVDLDKVFANFSDTDSEQASES